MGSEIGGERYMTIEDVMEALQIGKSTALEHIKAAGVPVYTLGDGGRIARYKESDIAKLIRPKGSTNE